MHFLRWSVDKRNKSDRIYMRIYGYYYYRSTRVSKPSYSPSSTQTFFIIWERIRFASRVPRYGDTITTVAWHVSVIISDDRGTNVFTERLLTFSTLLLSFLVPRPSSLCFLRRSKKRYFDYWSTMLLLWLIDWLWLTHRCLSRWVDRGERVICDNVKGRDDIELMPP